MLATTSINLAPEKAGNRGDCGGKRGLLDQETRSCFIAPPSVSKATGLFTDEGLLKCQGG